jgi:hypothetical protein
MGLFSLVMGELVQPYLDGSYVTDTPEKVATKIFDLEKTITWIETVAMESWNLDMDDYDGMSDLVHALKGELLLMDLEQGEGE